MVTFKIARISEIKNVGYTWMVKCNQLTALPFNGLIGWNKHKCTDVNNLRIFWRQEHTWCQPSLRGKQESAGWSAATCV